MFLSGVRQDGQRETIRIFMIARQVHGPNVPCIPAILLARRIAAGERISPGARPCLDLLAFDDIMGAIAHLDIDTTAAGGDFEESWPSPAVRRPLADA
jgi:hypothetical protein